MKTQFDYTYLMKGGFLCERAFKACYKRNCNLASFEVAGHYFAQFAAVDWYRAYIQLRRNRAVARTNALKIGHRYALAQLSAAAE